jgi:PTH1 family peptidyl-tRNA hydrolase
MFLLIGLGNPGSKYHLTKHNFGFLTIDALVANYKFISQSSKFDNEVFSAEISGQKIIAIKPQRFMNLSGEPVSKIVSFYKIPVQNIIVFHDDIDLKLGRVKVKIGGGDGGHNGLKDIDRVIGKDYMRVRLGIDRPKSAEYEVADYVLGKFSDDEMGVVGSVNQKVSKLLPLLLEGKMDDFMNQFTITSSKSEIIYG